MESFLYDTFTGELSDGKIPVKRKKIRRPGVCKICGKSFKDQKSVYVHKRIHTGEKPYICEVCGKCFNQGSNLKRHLEYHRGKKNFHCDICNKDFANKSKPYYEQHVLSHSGAKPFACELCDRRYSLKSSYDTHMRIHAKNSYKMKFDCNVCHAEFKIEYFLKKHMRIHDPDQEVYMCDLCKKVFTTPFNLNTHLAKKHDILTAHECKVCHKRYKSFMALRMHQKQQHQKQQYLKQHEEKTSSVTGIKQKRTRSAPKQRSSNKSNVCKIQNKDINNNAEIKTKEIAGVSTSTSYVKKDINPSVLEFILNLSNENRKFICGVCQQAFSSLAEINEHLKIHNQNVSVIQNEDTADTVTSDTHVKKLISPEQLKDLLSHGPVNYKFLCAVCQKDFNSATEINEHLSSHTNGENLFICGVCKGSFSSADILKNHINSTHILYSHA